MRTIAFMLLLAFTANFTIFCHCATAQKHSCCCEKQEKKGPCHSAQAVKFNLVEKQLADQIQAAPIPVFEQLVRISLIEPVRLPIPIAPNETNHPPPDILTLQQRLLI